MEFIVWKKFVVDLCDVHRNDFINKNNKIAGVFFYDLFQYKSNKTQKFTMVPVAHQLLNY